MELTGGASANATASHMTLSLADIKKLMTVALRMQRAGEKNHPKYQQIAALLRQYQQQRQTQIQTPPTQNQMKTQTQTPPPLDVTVNPFMQQKTTLFSDKQLEHLHNQIRAYKALCQSMDTAITQAKEFRYYWS
ncbi:unnamed protein product [Peronospora destructor]|uniref:Uncharacterized protein n=1 Tax=Peronospora destructor TaxID=86335 RepID=A0AAV0V0V4_9STRA|nr:unnamed protein product [Peronospora destructor]